MTFHTTAKTLSVAKSLLFGAVLLSAAAPALAQGEGYGEPGPAPASPSILSPNAAK